MPTYFGEVAPYCPVSRDQPTGPMPTRQIPIRTAIPRAHDLASAIAAVNILRTIVNQIVRDRVINNVYTKPPPAPRKAPTDRVIDKSRYVRWVEQPSKRVKRRYRYYGKEEGSTSGAENREVWVETERIEKMVWYDKAWKTYLTFTYGDKGEGEPVGTTPVEP
jgi:hypothetical protein